MVRAKVTQQWRAHNDAAPALSKALRDTKLGHA
jgi:hypothetical protein